MNRDDLLKRCVDRRVAHETSVVAVSHLFYVYLLSALKKGQRVEVPNFGTFGTHIVGVKRQRRMPFFEVENELADKVNERYKNLKTLLVGKFELTVADGEIEYTERQPPYDPLAEKMGKEVVLDTYREISAVQSQSAPTESRSEKTESPVRQLSPVEEKSDIGAVHETAPISKEKKLMPKLNLRGEGTEGEPTPPTSSEEGMQEIPMQQIDVPPTLRDISGGTGPSPLLQVLLGLLILGAITFALNHFGLIHLWGTKAPVVQSADETLPPVVQPPPQAESTTEQPGAQKEEPTIVPQTENQQGESAKKEPATTAEQKPADKPSPNAEKKPIVEAPVIPPAGSGQFTIQASSWPSRAAANRVVSRLAATGFDAYIVEGLVKGKTWYRVRVGRYATAADAQAGAAKLKASNENGVWVTKMN